PTENTRSTHQQVTPLWTHTQKTSDSTHSPMDTHRRPETQHTPSTHSPVDTHTDTDTDTDTHTHRAVTYIRPPSMTHDCARHKAGLQQRLTTSHLCKWPHHLTRQGCFKSSAI